MADYTVIDPARHYQRQSTRRMVVKNATTAYVFCSAGVTGNTPGYIKTTDKGVTWSAFTAVPGAGGAGPFDIYYAGWNPGWSGDNIVLLGWLGAPGANPNPDVQFAVFNLDTDTFTTSATVAFDMGGTFNYSGMSVCISRSGDYWLSGISDYFFFPDVAIPVLVRSTDDGATWANFGAVFIEAWRDEMMIWPDFSSADTNDILAIYADNSAGAVTVKQLDVSAVSIAETSIASSTALIGDGQTDPVIWSSTMNDDGVVYLVLMSVADPGTSKDFNTYTVDGASVTATTDVLTATTYASGPYIAFDANGVTRVFYGRDTAAASRESQSYFYKESSDDMATWGAEIQISDSDGYWISTGVGDPRPTGIVLPVWFDETTTYLTTDSPIEVGIALGGSLPMTFTLTGTLTGGVSAAPPVVIKCKPISITSVVHFTVRTLR